MSVEKAKDIARDKIETLSRFFGTDMMYVVRSGFWMNANFIVSILFGLTSSILFAHFVPKNVYGTYQFILALAASIAVVVPNNMSTAVLRSVARGNEGDFVKATRFQLRWGTIGSVVSISIAVWYAIHNNVGLSLALLVIALFMPASYALNTWGAYVQGKKDYRRYFFYSTFATVVSYGGVFAAIFFKPEFIWLAAANILFIFLGNFILYFWTKKRMRPNNQTSSDAIPYGVHLSVMGIPQGLVGQLDAILLFHFLGAEMLAIYSFATLLPEKIAGGLKFISAAALPKFSEKTEKDVKSFFRRKIYWLVGFISLVALAYAIFAPYIFEILFPKYMDSVPFTRVYALSFFAIIAGVIQTAVVSQRKIKQLYITTVSTPFLKAALLFVMLLYFGIWGVIWAQVIIIVFQILLPLLLFFRRS
jgi:O-antigen/teichoic acid export membrane protein